VIGTAVAVLVLAVIILSLVGATLSGIYRAAVYRFAATGQIGGGFRPALIQNAFRQQRSRGLSF
jgi:hypothetical protein